MSSLKDLEKKAVGVSKGSTAEQNVTKARTIGEMEESGEAKRIFDKWFGPQSDTPMKRTFRITKGK